MKAAEVNLLSIANAIEFIEAHLQEETSVAEMADAVCYSLFHFCRMFNAITQHTPYDYLMRRRLSNAAQVLLATDRKIIEIGFDYQFNSPETFARAFKRMFGMNPNEWRKRGAIPPRTLMPRLTLAHLRQRTHPAFALPGVEEWPMRYFAGLMTWVSANDATAFARLQGCLRDKFKEAEKIYEISISPSNAAFSPSAKQQIPLLGGARGGWRTLRDCQYSEPTPNPSLEGNSLLRGGQNQPNPEKEFAEKGCWYFAGVEIASPEQCPPAFVIKTLPAGMYLRCPNSEGMEQRPLARDYLYHTYLPQSLYALSFPLEIADAQTIWIPVQPLRSQQANSEK